MLISVIVTSVIARYLGTENYGLINYIVSIVMIYTAISVLGMEKITIKDLVSEEYNKGIILGTSFVLRIIGGILLLLISQITILILEGGNLTAQILGLIIGSCMTFRALEVIEYYLQAEMKMKVVSIIRFITAVSVAIFKISVVIFDLGIIAYAFSYLIDAAIAGFLFILYYRKSNIEHWKFSKEYAKKILSRCWYVAISGLMTTIYMRIDQVMLGSMLVEKSQNGIYSAAARIAEMWYFVPLAVITAFQPAIMKQKEADEKKYIATMQRLYDIVAIIGIICGIGISIFGKFAVNILYGPEYAGAENILVISVWAGIFATLGSARSVWLITEGLQKYTIVYTGVGCILNIVLNSIMIPKFGATGAAIATLITQMVANTIALIPFRKTRKSSIMIFKSLTINSTLIDIIKKIPQFFKKKKGGNVE